MAKPEVIIVKETLALSLARDAVTVGSLIGAALIGLWVGSTALQWMGCILVLVFAVGKTELGNRMTIPEARKRLDELERRSTP